MLGNCGFLRLAQTAAAPVFTHVGPDATLCGADINLVTQARHTVYTTRQQRISCVLYWPEKLVDFLGRFVNRLDAMPQQQFTYVVHHSPDVR